MNNDIKIVAAICIGVILFIVVIVAASNSGVSKDKYVTTCELATAGNLGCNSEYDNYLAEDNSGAINSNYKRYLNIIEGD